MSLSPGATLGPYAILAELGHGGMGVVYTAHDPRLDRMVAIKVLPPDLTRDNTVKQRFFQEAKAASALDHPNICTIHEINGTDDGQRYLVMAYYEGDTLKRRIERGPLALDEAIDIAAQVGQGLVEAHGAGIVHRDIKSANLLIAKGGVVKILDFGLAKLVGAEGVTQTGTTVGTVAYMSPEQARGEEVDDRTDIWSLGVVLYEMLTGQQPFQGENLLAISNAIQQNSPPALTGDTSSQNGLVSRALHKSQLQRYQAVGDLLDELRTATAPATQAPDQPEVPTIAVLPFTNMSADPEQEYFSDGLTEEIIADLSKVHTLLVVSRTSVMPLKGTQKSPKTIGRELNARYLLEGSVRKAGNNLRITAQLIDAAADVHVWAEKYRGTLEDVFEIQEGVSRSIVDALKLTLTPEEQRDIAQRPIVDIQAYDCYLKARRDVMRMSEDSLGRSVRALQEGLARAGDNSLLYGVLGDAYFIYAHISLKVDEQAYLQQLDHIANKILALDPEAPQGHSLRGFLDFKQRHSVDSLVTNLKRALAVDPNDTFALWLLCFVYTKVGKTTAATRLVEKFLGTDPLNPLSHWTAGWVYSVEDIERALGPFRRAHQMDPEQTMLRYCLARALAFAEHVEEACALLAPMVDTPSHVWSSLGLVFMAALQADAAAFDRAATPELVGRSRWDETFSWLMAESYALIGRRE